MSDMTKREIQELIETYGFEEILARFNLTPWKTLELLEDLGYILLECFEDN